MPRKVHHRPPLLRRGAARAEGEATAAVVGGGIAGVAAATVLAERGVAVTLLEQQPWLGGRAGAWTDRLADGTPFEMERGFHAFFRHYHCLRALLRRVDPSLSLLQPLHDYPILGPDGAVQSFAGLPTRTPFNILALARRSPALRWRDLPGVDAGRALQMLAYHPERSRERWDGVSAGAFLDSLRFPPAARRLLFDVFAHSFFNPEEEMSAFELLQMFHFYFTGNPQGLVFDVLKRPFSTALWGPFAARLEQQGVDLRLGVAATRLRRRPGGWEVLTSTGPVEVQQVVLASTVPGLQALVEASPDLDREAWRAQVASLGLTRPFAVQRLWLDRPLPPRRAPFVGTTGVGPLDNISLYHLFEDESREWAMEHGGAVVELHAYAVPEAVDEAELKRELWEGLTRLYPETRQARVLEERWLLRRDCPSFAVGSAAGRPGVKTPWEDLVLAGDFVHLPWPSALMERACASGFSAANHLLARRGVVGEPIATVPPRGLLAGRGA